MLPLRSCADTCRGPSPTGNKLGSLELAVRAKSSRQALPLPRTMGKSLQNFFAVYLGNFNQAGLVHISELASSVEIPTATAAVHVPELTGKSRDNSAKKLQSKEQLTIGVLGS